MNYISSFFLLADQYGCELTHPMVTSWLENNNVSEQVFNTLVSRFLEQGILYDDQRLDIDSRNHIYWSTYDSTIYADNFIQVLDGVQVAIVGCGTIGSSLALSLLKLNIRKFILFDKDIVERKNVEASTIFLKKDIHKCKVDVIQEYIKAECSDTRVRAIRTDIQKISDIKNRIDSEKVDYLFFCIDEYEDILLEEVLDYAEKLNIIVFIIGYQEDESSIMVLKDKITLEVIRENFRDNINISKSFPVNRGTILNATMLSSLLTNLVMSHVLEGELLSQVLTYNSKNLTFSKINLEKLMIEWISPEKYVSSLHRYLPINMYMDIIQKIEDKRESKHNRVQIIEAVMFCNLLDNVGCSNNDMLKKRRQRTESEVRVKLTKVRDKISELRRIKTTESVLEELQNINLKTHSLEQKFDLQSAIYESVAINEENIFELLKQTDDFMKVEQICGKYNKQFLGNIKNAYSIICEYLMPLINRRENKSIDYLDSDILSEVHFLEKHELFQELVEVLDSIGLTSESLFVNEMLKEHKVFYHKSVSRNSCFYFLSENFCTIHLEDRGYHQLENIIGEISKGYLYSQNESSSYLVNNAFEDDILNQIYIEALLQKRLDIELRPLLEAILVDRSRTILNIFGLFVFKLMLLHSFFDDSEMNLHVYDSVRDDFEMLSAKGFIFENQKITTRNYLIHDVFYLVSLDDIYAEFMNSALPLYSIYKKRDINEQTMSCPSKLEAEEINLSWIYDLINVYR